MPQSPLSQWDPTPEQAERALSKLVTQTANHIATNLRYDPGAKDRIAQTLRQTWSEHTARMATAMLVHAFALSGIPDHINKSRTITKWRRAIIESNDPQQDRVIPIAIAVAQQIHTDANTILSQAACASTIVRHQLDQGRNITGELIQHTVLNRKTLASYHTGAPIAAFLAEMAMPSAEELASIAGEHRTIRVIDPTSGAGTLLKAAADTFNLRLSQHPSNPASQNINLSLALTGFDILPANTALTSAALHQYPDAQQTVSTLPYGPVTANKQHSTPRPVSLGALELIDPASPVSKDLKLRDKHLQHGGQHLVIMNPPFTKSPSQQESDRNVDQKLGKTTPHELRAMENRSAALATRSTNQAANELAPMFAVLAQDLTAPGGYIALVLPMTAVSSPAKINGGTPAGWSLFRQNTARNFDRITVISLTGHQQYGASFSNETQIAEVILIARKLPKGQKPTRDATFINMTARPVDDEEAYNFAQAMKQPQPNAPGHEVNFVHHITSADRTIATKVTAKLPEADPWPIAGAADPKVVRTALNLRSGRLAKHTNTPSATIPVTTFKHIGATASIQAHNRRDFLITQGQPVPPALPYLDSRHPSLKNTMLLTPKHSAMSQSSQATFDAAQQAGTLQVAANHRYNSQPLAAAATSPSLAGPGWTTVRMDHNTFAQAIALWMNSTLGLVSQWAAANRTQPGMGYLPKSLTPSLITLDPRQFTPAQLAAVERIFNDISSASLLPAASAWKDPVRIELDRRMLQEALHIRDDATHALVRWLRNAWCSEPTVQALKAARKVHQYSMDTLRQELVQSDAQLEQALLNPHQLRDPYPPEPQPTISPQLLRDIADALEKADHAAGYTDLHLSAKDNLILITTTDAQGTKSQKTSNISLHSPHHSPVFLQHT